MKKFKTALIVIIAMISFVTVSSLNSTTAQAATWHKGTPKVLRGKWRIKHVSTRVDRLKVTKKRVYLYSSGPFHLKNIKYKKTGAHSYKVRGYEYTYLHAKTTISFKKIKGHKIIKYKGNYPGASWTKYVPR
ncbi:hypothetical protein [Lactiplantibacillus xiangfangensis]|uniref:Extracellular protein n=1 Tax=Lactiplantibacillus xiangfangensis TaxID=942150 RepID=A0A0R2MAT4_9LACO|nr:hypothetical protein [Lactiplantibacillus xiangfangensis]KRO10758.1 hypothetical protein IV64_GL002442 [Lactiplantibacillus xiangfangensis]